MGGNRLVKRQIYATSEMDVESNAETLLLFPTAAPLDRCDEQRSIHFNQLPWSEVSMKIRRTLALRPPIRAPGFRNDFAASGVNLRFRDCVEAGGQS
jgi:hypothetical protein